jgi:hypothetical protein
MERTKHGFKLGSEGEKMHVEDLDFIVVKGS